MDLGAARTDTVGSPRLLIPVGSCEQHGPHLPLATDTIIAEHLCRAVARERTDLAVTPPIAIAASGEHAGFAGTLSIGADVLTQVLIEIGRSADWSSGCVFVNAHGGNVAVTRDAVDVLTSEGRPAVMWGPTGGPTDLHAGHIETSVMLWLHPDRVGDYRAVAPVHIHLSDVIRDGVHAHSPSGVLGDPRTATANEGRDIVTRWTADLMSFLDTTS